MLKLRIVALELYIVLLEGLLAMRRALLDLRIAVLERLHVDVRCSRCGRRILGATWLARPRQQRRCSDCLIQAHRES